MKTHITFLCLFLVVGSITAYADNRPPWMYGDMPARKNSSYYFKVASGEGHSSGEARNNAILALVSEMSRTKGVAVKGRDVLESIAQQDNGRYSENTRLQSSYTFEAETFKIAFEIVDEYTKGKTCWLLFEVGYLLDNAVFKPVEFTTQYGARGWARSMFIPGWGQMYKGGRTKGIVIFSAEAVSVAGIFVCDNLSRSYYQKTIAERNTGVRESYNNRYATYSNLRNGCIVAAGAIYAYNIVDAVAGKGTKRYKKTKRYAMGAALSPEGIALSLNF